MFLRVVEVKHAGCYRLKLKFNDGRAGEVDLKDRLSGEVFRPLQDETMFAQVRLEGPTVAWPNGADLAPEYLAELLVAES